MSAYEALHAYQHKTAQLQHLDAITSWDEEVMMPTGGGAGRAEALATLAVMIHERQTSSELADLIAAAEQQGDLDPWRRRNVALLAQRYRQDACLPADLVRAKTQATKQAQQVWRVARGQNDWDSFAPHLSKIVELAQHEAQVRSAASRLTPYGALLEVYQPGFDEALVEREFAALRGFLAEFVPQVVERQRRQTLVPLPERVAAERQRRMMRPLMERMGFDFAHGRLDESHHPFCGGVPSDVRLTTRYLEEDFTSGFLATIHETGHALYEQGLPRSWEGQPVGEAAGMAVHESQSLLVEMQVGRSAAFAHFVAPLLRETLAPERPEAFTPENLTRHFHRVQPSLIRVDADEVTYPLHVIMRYELEKALLSGDLPVGELPAAWNERMQDLLGLQTLGNDRDGCMQDVHWTCGLIGYFPCYTLGAIMAAQFFAAARQAIPELDGQIAAGEFSALRAWQREQIHGRGHLLPAQELLRAVIGEPFSSAPYIEHLRRRYGDA